jgi:hypothetical protein
MRLPLPALSVGALLTAACTSLRPIQPSELTPEVPTRVWVTRADHSTVVFDSAHVSGDTLVGIVNGQPQRLVLSEVTVLRARGPSGDRTAALVFFGVGGPTAVLIAYFSQRNTTPPFVCPLPVPDGLLVCNNDRSICCESLQ